MNEVGESIHSAIIGRAVRVLRRTSFRMNVPHLSTDAPVRSSLQIVSYIYIRNGSHISQPTCNEVTNNPSTSTKETRSLAATHLFLRFVHFPVYFFKDPLINSSQSGRPGPFAPDCCVVSPPPPSSLVMRRTLSFSAL